MYKFYAICQFTPVSGVIPNTRPCYQSESLTGLNKLSYLTQCCQKIASIADFHFTQIKTAYRKKLMQNKNISSTNAIGNAAICT